MKRKDSKFLILFLILALMLSACSSTEPTEKTKKKNKAQKTTKEASEIIDEEETKSGTKVSETTAKTHYEVHSFKGLEYSVPVTFFEFKNEETLIGYQNAVGDCIILVSAEEIAGADASNISSYDFELNRQLFTDKYSYGGQVLEAGYKELSDYWVWYESSDVKDGDIAGLYYVNMIIDKENNYAYELAMGIRTTDETKRSNYLEIWNEISQTYKKDLSFTPPKPVEHRIPVYEDERVKIEFIKVDAKGVHFDVENLTDANITIQADSIAVNGRSVNDILMSDDVAPHSIGEVVAKGSFDYKQPLGTLGGQLRIIDFNKSFKSYDAVFDSVVIDSNVVVDIQPTGTLVFEDERVRIYYKKCDTAGVVFEVENLTSVNITIQADSISINKRSISSILMSDDVAPHSIGEVTAKCSLQYDGAPSIISGQLRVIDFNKSFRSYDASFVDVDISSSVE